MRNVLKRVYDRIRLEEITGDESRQIHETMDRGRGELA